MKGIPVRKRLRALWTFGLALLWFLHPAAAGDVPDVFDPSSARRPRPGEWLEYRIAFPVDPLENSLSAAPVPPLAAKDQPLSDGDEESLDAPFAIIPPVLESPEAWRVLPLRLELREITDEGVNAVLTFAGESHEVFLPSSGEEPADFYYDERQSVDARTSTIVNGSSIDVEVTRRVADDYGFVRYFSPDVPFGIVRFATENVDLVLVGTGYGRPPEFPLDAGDPNPPAGALYRNGAGQ